MHRVELGCMARLLHSKSEALPKLAHTSNNQALSTTLRLHMCAIHCICSKAQTRTFKIQKRLLTDLDLNNISNYNILTPSDEPGLTASAASPGR